MSKQILQGMKDNVRFASNLMFVNTTQGNLQSILCKMHRIVRVNTTVCVAPMNPRYATPVLYGHDYNHL